MKINYKTEAIVILLEKDCILERYYPLVPIKNELISYLMSIECFTKEDCLLLKEDKLSASPLSDKNHIELFRHFLVMYDVSNSKMKEIDKLALSEEEAISYRQLYLLPGVRETRARLYYCSGYRTLVDIANSSSDEVISRTKAFIQEMKLDIKAPLVKEAKTHIAVSKIFTEYRVM